jgi:hypothetical protein
MARQFDEATQEATVDPRITPLPCHAIHISISSICLENSTWVRVRQTIMKPFKEMLTSEVASTGLEAMVGLVVLRNKAIKPLLAAAQDLRTRRGAQNPRPLDRQYATIRTAMQAVFQELGDSCLNIDEIQLDLFLSVSPR